MKRFLAITLFTSFLTCLYCAKPQHSTRDQSRNCEPCSDSVLASVDRVKHLTQADVEKFLCTLDSSCSSAVEFSETSNELLFSLLTEYPEYCINVLNEPAFQNRLPYILHMIESPINDVIDLRDVYDRINQTSSKHKDTKQTILRAIASGIKNQ
jgi:hypothetical protein